jgi:hypothetical protein
MAYINFQVDPNLTANSYGLLPKGRYLAMAIASEMKTNAKGTGEYLQITFEVIDGPSKGRKIFERLNIRNANKVAERIALEQLNELCKCAGVTHLVESEELHNLPLFLDLAIESGRDGFDDQNRIKGYGRSNTSQPRQARVQPIVTTSSAPAAASTPVWKRKPAQAPAPQIAEEDIPY